MQCPQLELLVSLNQSVSLPHELLDPYSQNKPTVEKPKHFIKTNRVSKILQNDSTFTFPVSVTATQPSLVVA